MTKPMPKPWTRQLMNQHKNFTSFVKFGIASVALVPLGMAVSLT